MLIPLRKLFRQKPGTVACDTKIKVLERTPFDMRLAEWRADRTLTNSARTLFAERNFYTMLQVIANEHPSNMVVPDAVPIEQRAILQARAEGYTLALSNLAAMAKHEPMRLPIEATFEPEQQLDITINQ